MAQALLHDPDVLILDEPLSGIDPVGRTEFVSLFRDLARRGKCLLVSSHELEELEKLTDHVAIMARGRIAAVGTLPQIRELLDGKMSIPQCVAAIQQATRRYAKRQLTWFRRQTNFQSLNLSLLSQNEAVKEISQLARSFEVAQGND